jgi:hypothetical protein
VTLTSAGRSAASSLSAFCSARSPILADFGSLDGAPFEGAAGRLAASTGMTTGAVVSSCVSGSIESEMLFTSKAICPSSGPSFSLWTVAVRIAPAFSIATTVSRLPSSEPCPRRRTLPEDELTAD